MWLRSGSIAWLFAVAMTSANAQKLELSITSPVTDAAVAERLRVEGTVHDPSAAVYVIVHPSEVSDDWVRPNVTVNEDGTWQTIVNIGRPKPWTSA